MKHKIYYNGNSIDCSFVNIINNLLTKFDSIEIDSHTTDIDNFEPITTLLIGENTFWFIGMKPSQNWVTENPNIKIIVIYRDFNYSTEYNNMTNVITEYINNFDDNDSLSSKFLGTIIKYQNTNGGIFYIQPNNFGLNFSIVNKLKIFLNNFENYYVLSKNITLEFSSEMLNSLHQIINFVSLSKATGNKLPLNDLIINTDSLISYKNGLLMNNSLSDLSQKLYQNSYVKTISSNNKKVLKISVNPEMEELDILLFDRVLSKYLIENYFSSHPDYIEYYRMNSSQNTLDVICYTKKINMLVSPIELKSEDLIDYVGIDNKTEIINYLLEQYGVEDYKQLSNGLIKFKTTLNTFFN